MREPIDRHEVALITKSAKLEAIAPAGQDGLVLENADEHCSVARQVVFFHWADKVGIDGRVVDVMAKSAEDTKLKAYVCVDSRRVSSKLVDIGGEVLLHNTGVVYRRSKKREQDVISPLLVRMVSMFQAAYVPLQSRLDILPDLNVDKCVVCKKQTEEPPSTCCICLMVTHASSCRHDWLRITDSMPKQQHSLLPVQLLEQCSRTPGNGPSFKHFLKAF